VRFRHLLERHHLTEKLFGEVRVLLEERKLLLHPGTIVDATIINAPSSTKNATGTRDPAMQQTRQGKQW
jgi:IS5 family transposase